MAGQKKSTRKRSPAAVKPRGVLWLIVVAQARAYVRAGAAFQSAWHRPWGCAVLDDRGRPLAEAMNPDAGAAIDAALAAARRSDRPDQVVVAAADVDAVAVRFPGIPAVPAPPEVTAGAVQGFGERLAETVASDWEDPLGRGIVPEPVIDDALAAAATVYGALPSTLPHGPALALVEPASDRPALVFAGTQESPFFFAVDPEDISQVLADLADEQLPTVASASFVFVPLEEMAADEQQFLRARGWTPPVGISLTETDADGVPAPVSELGLGRLGALARLVVAAGLSDAATAEPRVVELEGGRVIWLAPPALVPEVDGDVYELDVTLEGIEPPITRRLEVRGGLTLAGLHVVLQAAMGWEDSHLHEFKIGRATYGCPDDDDWGAKVKDEAEVRLDEVLRRGLRFRYRYDFGDSWGHAVRVVRVRPADDDTPPARCTGGARACPPEDCGGPHSYLDLLDAFADARHPDHARAVEWLGDVDPEAFDPDRASAAMADILDGAVDGDDGDDDPAVDGESLA